MQKKIFFIEMSYTYYLFCCENKTSNSKAISMHNKHLQILNYLHIIIIKIKFVCQRQWKL